MSIEDKVIGKLKTIIDPHTGTSVYDMNLIADLKIEGEKASLIFKPSSPYCPLGIQLATAIKRGVESVEGIKEVALTVSGHIQEKEINRQLAN